MKRTVIITLVLTLRSICVAQTEKDTVNIYWPNGQLKYMSICCFVDTVDSQDAEPILIATRTCQMWDENANKIELQDYLQRYKDIVNIDAIEGMGDDEKEYRKLIAMADNAFDSIDISDIETVNKTIKSYVKALEKIPEALYPQQKLEKIQELIKN